VKYQKLKQAALKCILLTTFEPIKTRLKLPIHNISCYNLYSMTLILNIETSTKVCSVSLGLNGELLAFKEESSDKYIHSEKLNVFIEELFTQVDYELKDLAAVCVSKGPGSYTGLRIGVSSAKGFCYALDIPLISIDSLSVLASGYLNKNFIAANTILMPMIDARRMEVYTAAFNNKAEMLNAISAEVIDAEFFDGNKEIILIGDGAEKCNVVITENVRIENHLSSSIGMIKLSYLKFSQKEFEDVAYFEPFYLKDFIAV
jgi:tRNA threonylcarbamoyladenosine biosynthesis protein TsaB